MAVLQEVGLNGSQAGNSILQQLEIACRRIWQVCINSTVLMCSLAVLSL